MSLLEIILISIGLTMDVFAYALLKGAMMSEIRKMNLLKICSIFTFWQVISMILGNLLTNIPFTAKLGMDVGHDSNTFSDVYKRQLFIQQDQILSTEQHLWYLPQNMN